MKKYPKALSRFFPNLVFALAIPAFFLVSVLLYEPEALCQLMRAGEGVSSLENVFIFNVINIAFITAKQYCYLLSN